MRKNMMKSGSKNVVLAGMMVFAVVALTTTGCATKKYVQEQVTATEERVEQHIDQVEGQVEANQTRLGEQEKLIKANAESVASASQSAKEAYERAIAAGELAEGKFVYETSLSDEDVSFSFDKAGLSDGAKAALDGFAQKVKGDNKNVYIEVQGHTDSIGSEDYNLKLGQQRAEAVRDYLIRAHGFPVHRIAALSYGESEPVADNGTREGRSQNRRVVLVVLH
jgi:outer membrane protein OmpA-like peptidoglycan-associated protein